MDCSKLINNNMKSITAESYRTLRTNIQFLNFDKEIKTIIVTSSEPKDGKSTISINLAISLGLSGKKVLLIDGDIRKPQIHKYIGLNNKKGLTSILLSDVSNYKEIIYPYFDLNTLSILTSGVVPPNPSELLGSNKMRSFMKIVKKDFDIVIIDTPTVGIVTDAMILSSIVDGVILVCEEGRTKIDTLRNTKILLENVEANILGVVINKINVKKDKIYSYDK